MHVIFLHGVTGVGKRTIAKELATELGFSFLNFHHLASLLGPVFGYSSNTFAELRNEATHRMIEQAMELQEDGIICTFTYDPTISLERYRTHIDAAKISNCIGLFVGLTCDDKVLQRRVKIQTRRFDDDISDLQRLEESLLSGNVEIPELPGPSISIDTAGESSGQSAQNIIALLPDSMKQALSF